LQEWQLRPKVI